MSNDKPYHKITKYVLIFFSSLSLAFISLNISTLSLNKETFIRHLELDQNKINAICLNGPKSVQDYYVNKNSTELFPEDEEKKDENSYTQTLLDIFDGNTDTSKITKYVVRLLAFVIFIVFGILSIFGWIICCCCCCCPCCCCNQTAKNQYLCRLISFLISMGMFVVIIGLSLYGLIDLQNIMKGLNGMSCTVFKLYTEVSDGQEAEITPKWTGINNIQNKLVEISQTVENIGYNRGDIFTKTPVLGTKETNFKNLLSNAAGGVARQKISFTATTTTNNPVEIIPGYVTDYYPVETGVKTAYQINFEFEQLLTKAKDIINQADSSSSEIVNESDSINILIGDIDSLFNDFGSTLDSFSSSIAEPWMDYQKTITDYGKLGCNIFFGVLVGLSGLIIGLTIVFVLLKIKFLKIFILIFWNILVLIMILTFIIGGVFGLLGIIGKDGTSVIYYLISEENLNSTSPKIIPDSIGNYIDVCMHGDGDLSSKFSIGSGMDEMEKLNQLKAQLQATKAELQQFTGSTAINTNNNYLLQTKDSFSDASTTIRDDYINPLNEAIKNCNTDNQFEKVEDSQKNCGEYTYIPYSNSLPVDTNKKCLLFSDWTTAQLKARYDGCNNNITISNLLDDIGKIKESNNGLIDDIIAINNNLDTQFKLVIDFVIDILDEIDEKLITPTNQVLGEIGNDPEKSFISTLINCRFLGGHIKMIYTNIHDGLGNNFYNFAIVIETISCAIALGVSCLIIVLNRFNKTFPEDKKKEVGKADADNGVNSELIQINKQGGIRKSLEKGRIVIKKS